MKKVNQKRLANELTDTRSKPKETETIEMDNPALEKIIESEARLGRLIDTLPVCISYVDATLHYRLNNKTYEDWFGFSQAELVGKHVKDVLGEEAFAENKHHYAAILSGETVTFENTIPLEDGKVRNVVGTHVPDIGENGEVRGFFALISDVTDRVKAEKEFREHEERFRNIYMHSNDAIFIVDPQEDRILSANPQACTLLGYSEDELLAMRMSAIHPNEMPEMLSFSRSVFQTGQGWTNELTCTTKVGQVLPAEISASVVEMEGQPYMLALIRDTTERKEAEMRIQREAAHADALARAASRLNAHLTVEGVARAVCQEAQRSLNVEAVALLLHNEGGAFLAPIASCGLPADYIESFKPIPRSLYDHYKNDQGQFIFIPEIQAEPDLPNAKLHSRHKVRSVGVVSLLRESRLIGTLNIHSFAEVRQFNEDETALLQGLADQAAQAIENAELRQRAEQAAVAEERNRLARDLHDSVTQALYSQTLYAEAASRQLTAGDTSLAVGYLKELQKTAQQALQEMRLLIFELRPPVLEEQGLVAALETRLEAVEGRAGMEKEIKLIGELSLPPELETALYRIAQEALNNTLKYSQADQVTVLVAQEARSVSMEIKDNGIGFDTSKTAEPGGIGLQSMQERVEMMGGQITIESELGTGTRIKVEVPL